MISSRSLTRILRKRIRIWSWDTEQIHSNEVTDQCLPACLCRKLCKGLGLPPGAGDGSKAQSGTAFGM